MATTAWSRNQSVSAAATRDNILPHDIGVPPEVYFICMMKPHQKEDLSHDPESDRVDMHAPNPEAT